MRRIFGHTLLVLTVALFAATAYAQQTAGVGGVVQDKSQGAMPGVTVTITNTGTNITSTMQSNESGGFNFPSLPAGTYKLQGQLKGFKTAVVPKIELTTQPLQFDLTMEVGEIVDTIIVGGDPNDALRATSATIGDVLPEYRIRELPMVTNDVLDLVRLLPGYQAATPGDGEFDRIGGLNLNFVNTTVNGLSVTDGRWANLFNNDGVSSGTRLNPDLVSEIRLILAPVDAEYGRGNAQVQITTRSGSNNFSGSIRFTPRNNGLDANSWSNNNDQSADPADNNKIKWRPTQPNWNNTMDYTITYGGPIRKNKTFFFALYNQVINNTRQLNSTTGTNVLSDPMRQGIFRYFTGYTAGPANQVYPAATANATSNSVYPSVNWDGSIRVPAGLRSDPQNLVGTNSYLNGINGLRCINIFGGLKAPGQPWTDADCVFNDGAGNPVQGKFINRTDPSTFWDPRRTAMDPTGYIQGLLANMPHPNFWGGSVDAFGGFQTTNAKDGLNIAGFRFVRGRNQAGQSGITAGVGTNPDVTTWNTNIRIDHNISVKHRLSVNWSYQPSTTHFAAPEWPQGVAGLINRRPQNATANLTSTLSSTLVNDFRMGFNYVKTDFYLPWNLPDQKDRDYLNSILPNGGLLTGGLGPSGNPYPVVYLPSGGGQVNGNGNADFGAGQGSNASVFGTMANGIVAFGSAQGQAYGERTPLFNFSNSVSWTKGKHSLRFNGEVRFVGTKGYGIAPGGGSTGGGIGNTCGAGFGFETTSGSCNFTTYPTVFGGTVVGSESPFVSLARLGEVSEVNEGQPNGTMMLAGFGTTAGRVEQAQYMFYGGLAGAQMQRWVTGASDFVNGSWQDISTVGERMYRSEVGKEWAAFVQDNWRLRRTLTLNAGVRWEYYEPRQLENGLTTAIRDTGFGLFGTHRLDPTVNQLDTWTIPGNLYFSGYGPAGSPGVVSATGADTYLCTSGVQQNSFMPISTCDTSKLTALEFVGMGIVRNPGESDAEFNRRLGTAQTPKQKLNFAPSISLSWQPNFLGAGKTTVRVGYSQTYGGTGRQVLNSNAGGSLTTVLDNASAQVSSLVTASHALQVTDVASLIPVPVPIDPLTGQLARPSQPSAAVYSGGVTVGTLTAFDPDYKIPTTRNVTFAITRNISRSVTLNLNYVSTMGRRLQGNLNVNMRNTFYNPELYQALQDARNGQDPLLLDQVLAGLNPVTTVAGSRAPNGTYAAVGTFNNGPDLVANTPDDVLIHGGAQLRRWSTTAANLANGNYDAVVASIIAMARTVPGMLPIPIAANVGNHGFRNGCNRLAAGAAGLVGTAPLGQIQVGGTRTSPIYAPMRCFSEDYVTANPQIGTGNYTTNLSSSDYNSLQTQVSIRPNRSGISFTSTYSFSKTISISGANAFRDPVNNREVERGIATSSVKHDFRSNGTFSVPVGPNQLFFGNVSGWKARIIEGWKMSLIYNVRGGRPVNLGGGATNFYGANTFDVVGPWTTPSGKVRWDGPSSTNPGNALGPDGVLGTSDDGHDTGTFFGNSSPYFPMNGGDPQCRRPGITDTMGYNLNEACTLSALGMYVDSGPAAGTTPEFLVVSGGTTRPAVIALQQAQPGTIGNLTRNTLTSLSNWSLDANLSKDFRVRESTRVTIRLDARNVMNHPTVQQPSFNITGTTFGQITTKSGNRTIAGNISINFQKYPFQ